MDVYPLQHEFQAAQHANGVVKANWYLREAGCYLSKLREAIKEIPRETGHWQLMTNMLLENASEILTNMFVEKSRRGKKGLPGR